jgi:hypothetical protein
MEIIKNFISKEDVELVQKYISTVSFHTKDNHVPLHDDLYEKYNAPFDLHTRGEMPSEILNVFSKYSEGFYNTIMSLGHKNYLPPMFSKHYIARYVSGKSLGPQYDESKPEGTYKSIIFWNNDFEGGELEFVNLNKTIKPEPGDLVYFVESEKNRCAISKITNGDMYISEAWMGISGELWMPSSIPYEEIDWNNWEIKGF